MYWLRVLLVWPKAGYIYLACLLALVAVARRSGLRAGADCRVSRHEFWPESVRLGTTRVPCGGLVIAMIDPFRGMFRPPEATSRTDLVSFWSPFGHGLRKSAAVIKPKQNPSGKSL